MNRQLVGSMGVGLAVWIGLAACTTQEPDGSNNNQGGFAGSPVLPGGGVAGTVAGTGVAGDGVAGTGVAGDGVAGTGVAGTGVAGDGVAGTGVAGTGVAGTGQAGMDAAGTGGADATQECIAEAAAMNRTGACTECGCMRCLQDIMNCTDEACSSVVACGQAAGCKGRDCYCGVGVDVLMCAINGASGPCMNEIATASGVCTGAANMCATMLSAVTNPTSDMYDANNPVSRANAVSVCTRGQVADPGVPLLVPAVPAIAGMCETECAQ
jgi:hypothetical protein